MAHLPIDVRAAGAIGVEAVHALLGHDVHRIGSEGERVLDVLAGSQSPNDEGPVIEGSSAQVLTVGHARRGLARVAMIDRGFVSRQGRGGRDLDPRPAARVTT